METGGVVVSPFSFFEKTPLLEVKMRPEVVGPLEGCPLGRRVLGLSCVASFLAQGMKKGGEVVTLFSIFGKPLFFEVKMRPEVVGPLQGHVLGLGMVSFLFWSFPMTPLDSRCS
jgi:hypothetical protein